MSHTSIVRDIIVTDIHAVRSAIAELKQRGVDCELLENAVPRAYSSNQAGMGVAPYCIKLNSGKYDVGLYETDDKKGYEARCDFWTGDVERQLGVANPKTNQEKLGKFYQSYATHAAMRQAAQQGYQVQRVDQADGSVQLRMTVH